MRYLLGIPVLMVLMASFFAQAADSASPAFQQAVGASSGQGVARAPEPRQTVQPLKVVASFSILGDMVKQIGGADVSVETLVGPDGDAHAYEPTPAAVRALAKAQLLVINGLNFETWLKKLVRTAHFKGKIVVAATGVTPLDFEPHDSGRCDADDQSRDKAHRNQWRPKGSGSKRKGGVHTDPHAWQSLANGVLYARNIGAALQQVDPAHAQAYISQTERYIARMLELETRVKQALSSLPPERRQVVVSHDAFAYFGLAYGITFISTMGISSEAEPSARAVACIITKICKEKVPAVFLENISNPRLEQQIVRETKAKLGGTLYSDALANPGLPASTYLGMFEWNLTELMTALKP
jgi:zinc/manganese transport system substrate-binding protein